MASSGSARGRGLDRVMDTTIGDAFRATVDRYHDRGFIAVPSAAGRGYHEAGIEFTYGEAAIAVDALVARYREAGYGHGHRVALALDNRPEHVLHRVALNSLGISCVPINPDYRSAEIAYLLEHSDAALVVHLARHGETIATAIAEIARPVRSWCFEANEDAFPLVIGPASGGVPGPATEGHLLYTSGTTGRPKGCVLSHQYELMCGAWYASLDGLFSFRLGVERVYNPLPLYHVNSGIVSILGMMLIGGLALVIISPLSVAAARGVTRPVNHLVEEIEKVREGQYDEQAIMVESSDEIGIMATAFKDMVRELREQRELIDFLEQSMTERTALDLKPPADSVGATVSINPSQMMGTMTPSLMGDEVRRAMDGQGELPTGFLLAHRYEIISILGRGGMGVVYRARDKSLDEVVAIKMLHMDSSALADMLKQETKLARKVTHRNLLRIFDLGELDEDIQFISMEYVNGTTMKDALRRSGRLPPGIGLRVTRQVCKGLYAAHSAGIIHGDIKPENIIINNRGEVKVMDFGVARLANVAMRDGDMISGTPAYMAPEQIKGRPEIRSDIYSLGIMIFEFFAGGTPFKGRVQEVLRHHMESPIPDLGAINPELPVQLIRVVNKATRKNADERYASIREMLADLKGIGL